MSHCLLTSLLFLSFVLFSLQDCKGPITNECGCIFRRTFTTEWLKLNFPSLAAAWWNIEFTAPVATYPKCGEGGQITFTCPVGQRIVILFPNDTLAYDNNTYPNPTVLSAECEKADRRWYAPGLTDPIDSTFNTSSIACTIKV